MGRSKEEVATMTSGGGLFLSIMAGITAAAYAAGATHDDIHELSTPNGKPTLAKIGECIAKKTAEATSAISVAWSSVLGWVIGLGRFTYVNPDITAEHFPCQPSDFAIKEVEIVKFGRDVNTEEALRLLDEKGFRPATLMELLWWWLTHPAEHGNCLVVALGSVWAGLVPCVGGDGADRGLGLPRVARDWSARCSFAGVRKGVKAA